MQDSFFSTLGISKTQIGTSTEDLIGLRVYKLTKDKIISIIENHGPKGHLDDSKFSITPERHCHIFCSGRESPFTSRAEAAKMIEGIDVFIISACTELVFARQFLQWIDYTSLPQSAVVIVRLPFADEEKPFLTYHASWWMQDMGLTPEGKEKRGSRVSRKIRRKTFVLGMSGYGGMPLNEGISEIQSHLSLIQNNRSGKFDKPIKETLNAGQSLFNSLTSWLFKRTPRS